MRNRVARLAVLLPACAAAAAIAQPADPALPAGPFRTVHLLDLPPDREAPLAAAVRDVNRAMADGGCPGCAYHLFRLAAGTGAKPDAMIVADWPGAAEYLRVHSLPTYVAANRRNPAFAALAGAEYYGRFVEVK